MEHIHRAIEKQKQPLPRDQPQQQQAPQQQAQQAQPAPAQQPEGEHCRSRGLSTCTVIPNTFHNVRPNANGPFHFPI